MRDTLGTEGGHYRIYVKEIRENRAWIWLAVESIQWLIMLNSIMNQWAPENVADFLTN
jgi:hypothetical protein